MDRKQEVWPLGQLMLERLTFAFEGPPTMGILAHPGTAMTKTKKETRETPKRFKVPAPSRRPKDIIDLDSRESKTLAHNVVTTRRALGQTQNQAASESGVAQRTIAKIEGGTDSIKWDKLNKLAKWMGTSMEDATSKMLALDYQSLVSDLRLIQKHRPSSPRLSELSKEAEEIRESLR